MPGLDVREIRVLVQVQPPPNRFVQVEFVDGRRELLGPFGSFGVRQCIRRFWPRLAVGGEVIE